jgi:peroxiredoxin
MKACPAVRFGAVAAAALLLAALVSTVAKAELTEGKSVASIPSLKDTDGGVFGASAMKDKYTLFFFFSIYSDNTKELLNYMSELNQRISASGNIQVIGVNVDPSPEEVKRRISNNKFSFRVLLDISLDLSDRLAVKNTPGIFIIDPNMEVRYSGQGFDAKTRAALESKLSDLNGHTPKRQPPAGESDSRERDFKKKKLVSDGATLTKFCPSDGNRLIYISRDDMLWIFNISDMSRKKIAKDASSADWSPACDMVVYSGKEKAGVWTVSPDEKPEPISPEGEKPLWSPAGDMIAFMAGESVWVYSFSTGKRWQTGGAGLKMQWSSDGALLLVSDGKNRVWLVSPHSKASLLERILK